jgi:hypothetical protein
MALPQLEDVDPTRPFSRRDYHNFVLGVVAIVRAFDSSASRDNPRYTRARLYHGIIKALQQDLDALKEG